MEGHPIEIPSCRAGRNTPIGEGRDHRPIRRVEADDNVPVTRQVLRKRRVIGAQGSAASPQNDHWIHCLFSGDFGVGPTVRFDAREIAAEKSAEDEALMVLQGPTPVLRKIFRLSRGRRRGGWVPDPDSKVLLGVGNGRVGIDPRLIPPNISGTADSVGATGGWQRCRPPVVHP